MEVIAALYACFCLRVRGGGFIDTNSTQLARAIGALGLMVLVFVLHGAVYLELGILAFIGFFLSYMLVPHAFCQNMGRWPVPQTGWPTWYFPKPSVDRWQSWSIPKRQFYDFLQFTHVGFIRGSIAGAFLVTWLGWSALLIAVFYAIFCPIVRLVGFYVPLNLPSLEAKSTEWGEFLEGIAWAISIKLAMMM